MKAIRFWPRKKFAALNYLIDRNDLREKTIGVKKGDKESPCELISGPFVQSSPYYNRSIPVVERRYEAKATSLLNRAGLEKKGRAWYYNGEQVRLRIGMKETLNKEALICWTRLEISLEKQGLIALYTRLVLKNGVERLSLESHQESTIW